MSTACNAFSEPEAYWACDAVSVLHLSFDPLEFRRVGGELGAAPDHLQEGLGHELLQRLGFQQVGEGFSGREAQGDLAAQLLPGREGVPQLGCRRAALWIEVAAGLGREDLWRVAAPLCREASPQLQSSAVSASAGCVK